MLQRHTTQRYSAQQYTRKNLILVWNRARIFNYTTDCFHQKSLCHVITHAGHKEKYLINPPAIFRFNKEAKPIERFDGILLDIEPYLLNTSRGDPLDWASDHEQIWRLYLEVLDQIAERVRVYNASTQPAIRLGECIPDFYAQQGAPAFENISYRDVMDRVDFTWLMCYRDTKEVIVKMSQDEIRYAAKAQKPVVLGLCVNQPKQDLGVTKYNTFWNEGVAALEKTIGSVREHYSDVHQLGEISIFSYIHYKEMQP